MRTPRESHLLPPTPTVAALLVSLLAPAAVAQVDLVFDVEIVARRGDLAPGSTSGLVFEHFGEQPGFGSSLGSPPSTDGDGNVAFHVFLGDGDPATVDSGSGVWRFVGGALEKVAELNDTAPGVVPATPFSGFPKFIAHQRFGLPASPIGHYIGQSSGGAG